MPGLVILLLWSFSARASFKEFCKKTDLQQIARLERNFELAGVFQSGKSKKAIPNNKVAKDHIEEDHLIPVKLPKAFEKLKLTQKQIDEILSQTQKHRSEKPITSFFREMDEIDEVLTHSQSYVPMINWISGNTVRLRALKLGQDTHYSGDLSFVSRELFKKAQVMYQQNGKKLSQEDFSNIYLPIFLDQLGVEKELAFSIYNKFKGPTKTSLNPSQFQKVSRKTNYDCGGTDTKHDCYNINFKGINYEIKACKKGERCKPNNSRYDTTNGISSVYPICHGRNSVLITDQTEINDRSIITAVKRQGKLQLVMCK